MCYFYRRKTRYHSNWKEGHFCRMCQVRQGRASSGVRYFMLRRIYLRGRDIWEAIKYYLYHSTNSMRTDILIFTLLIASALACNSGEFDDNGVCTACPSNTFSLNGNSTACEPCTGCAECDATNGDCTACDPGSEPVTGTCQACASGSFSQGQGACQTCDSSCLTCDSANGNCLSCETDKGRSGSTCVTCGTDQFVNPNFFCQNCNQSCLTCNGGSSSDCLSCNIDFGLVNNQCTICPNGTTSDGTGPCQQCTTANCTQCSDNDVCEECDAGLTLLSDKECGYPCSDIVSNCDLCEFTNICAVCQTGYTLDSTNNVCNVQTNCTDFCEACSSDTTCAQCMSGYTLYNNTCVDNCGVENCINCTDNVCQQCMDTYILFGSSCVIQCSITNCLSCAPAQLNRCQSCATGYSLSTDRSMCVVCNVPNCNSCARDNICGSCTGVLLNAGYACVTCSVDNCMMCLGDNSCLVCYQGYSLNTSPGATNADQCVACLDPCSTCYSDGSCKTCETPYSPVTLAQGTSCFLCFDPMCTSCTDNNNGSCTACSSGYSLISGQCQLICSPGCQTCTNDTVCDSCFSQFVIPNGDICSLCVNAPACKTCMTNDASMCMSCSDGYWLTSQNECMACPAYCKTCTSATWCTALFNPTGFTLLYVSAGVNYLAACDPGCQYCSMVNPQECMLCMTGFYLTASMWCKPCTAASQCGSCSSTDPAICTSCMADAYLETVNNTCKPCQSPCSACTGGNATMCTSCIQGYVYIQADNSCQAETSVNNLFNLNAVPNCANSEITIDSTGSNVLTCTLCDQGYTLTSGGCAPCPEGCQFCSPDSLTICLVCAPGFMLDANNVCSTVTGTTCPWGCDACTGLACFSCVEGLILNQNFQCQYKCMSPCATCQNNNPFACLSCVQGYTMTNGACQADNSCSMDGSCLTCPAGFILSANNDLVQINQVCTSCTASSNCARCMSTDAAVCTSCSYGMYLNGTICSSCATGCAQCLTLSMCQRCALGYVAEEPGTLQRSALNYGLLSCVVCTSPCASCSGNPDSCTTCISGFTLEGQVCMSSFNYAVSTVFNVNMTTFMANYLSFLQQVASSAGVAVSNVAIKSITLGSVVANLQITSFAAPGSAAAVANQNSLNNLLASGNIAGMPVTSFTLSTNGGTNTPDSGSSGLSTTTIIILAVCIPGGVLLIGLGIFLIYCYRKKRQQTTQSTYAPQQGWSSGRSMSSSRGVELMGYGTDRQRQQQRQVFM